MSRSKAPVAAMSVAELAAWVEASAVRAENLLFTGTAREDLDEVASWQRLSDLVFVGQCRAVVTAYNRASWADRQFLPDEVGLAIGASPTTGTSLTVTALQAAELPGLLEAVEAGDLTARHVHAVLRELGTVELSLEQRAAIVLVMLARMTDQTPGELARMVRRLILTVDLPAAQARAEHATRSRCVRFRGDVDGQGVLSARGPLAMIAAVKACLDTMGQDQPDPDDDRSADARMFDLFIDLLTGGSTGPGSFDVQVLVPVATALGGDLEPAEIPGLEFLLPSTARELLDTLDPDDTLRRVTVDAHTGEVLTVDDAITPAARGGGPTTPTGATDADTKAGAALVSGASRLGPAGARPVAPGEGATVREPALGAAAEQVPAFRPRPPRMTELLHQMVTDPVIVRDLSNGRYRPSGRLIRYLEARDRTCRFPGCHRPASRTDNDHRIPWPRGSTTADNLTCLCRRHHRAKHTSFTLTRAPDGTLWWTTRGGQRYPRHPHTY